ncbi:MAG: hypothetical protein ACE5JG_00460 [Planctomycetota bacterium]
MRRAWAWLLVSVLGGGAAAAGDYDPVLRYFREHRRQFYESGGRAVAFRAVDSLVATGDARALQVLAAEIPRSLKEELKVRARMKAEQKRGAEARERIQALEKHIGFLKDQIMAGASRERELQQKTTELEQAQRAFEEAEITVRDLLNLIVNVGEFREKLAQAAVSVLEPLEGELAGRALRSVRTSLDIHEREPGLFAVRILSAHRSPAAMDHLIAILEEPKADRAVVRAAIRALAPRRDPRALRALLALWQRAPELYETQIRSALSLVAGRPITTREEAKAWADSLPGRER